MFSVVLYLNQEVSPAGNEKMAQLTSQLIDTAADHGGTFYLPYQPHYTRAQLERAYPELDSFFELKRKYDPTLTFMNHWYDRYADDSVTRADTGSSQGYSMLSEPPAVTGTLWGADPEPLPPLQLSAIDPRAPPWFLGGLEERHWARRR
jgi:hypothetical protein